MCMQGHDLLDETSMMKPNTSGTVDVSQYVCRDMDETSTMKQYTPSCTVHVSQYCMCLCRDMDETSMTKQCNSGTMHVFCYRNDRNHHVCRDMCVGTWMRPAQ